MAAVNCVTSATAAIGSVICVSVLRPLLTVSGVMSLEATVPVLLPPLTVSFVLRMEMMLSMEKRGQPSLSTGALQALRTPMWRAARGEALQDSVS